MASANQQTLMDAGVLGEVDSSRVMSGNDAFDVEAPGEKTAFPYAGCTGASRSGNHFGQYPALGLQKLIGQRSEECSNAIGCNAPPAAGSRA